MRFACGVSGRPILMDRDEISLLSAHVDGEAEFRRHLTFIRSKSCASMECYVKILPRSSSGYIRRLLMDIGDAIINHGRNPSTYASIVVRIQYVFYAGKFSFRNCFRLRMKTSSCCGETSGIEFSKINRGCFVSALLRCANSAFISLFISYVEVFARIAYVVSYLEFNVFCCAPFPG